MAPQTQASGPQRPHGTARRLLGAMLTRENLLALLLALILVAVLIFTADTAPAWIYQGF